MTQKFPLRTAHGSAAREHEMKKSSRIVPFLSLAAAVLIAGGCASDSPRELSMVKADGNRAMALGQYDRARDFYGEWAERAPFDAQAHGALGKALLNMGRPALAREQFEIARELEPTNFSYLEMLCESLIAADDADDLRTTMFEVTGNDPTPKNYVLAGRSLQRVGSIDDAEQQLLTAARIDNGRTVEPYIALGDFYGALGDREEQIRRLRMALFVDPINAEVYSRLEALGQVPGPSLALTPTE